MCRWILTHTHTNMPIHTQFSHSNLLLLCHSKLKTAFSLHVITSSTKSLITIRQLTRVTIIKWPQHYYLNNIRLLEYDERHMHITYREYIYIYIAFAYYCFHCIITPNHVAFVSLWPDYFGVNQLAFNKSHLFVWLVLSRTSVLSCWNISLSTRIRLLKLKKDD